MRLNPCSPSSTGILLLLSGQCDRLKCLWISNRHISQLADNAAHRACVGQGLRVHDQIEATPHALVANAGNLGLGWRPCWNYRDAIHNYRCCDSHTDALSDAGSFTLSGNLFHQAKCYWSSSTQHGICSRWCSNWCCHRSGRSRHWNWRCWSFLSIYRHSNLGSDER